MAVQQESVPVRVAISNSFGFGGCSVALVFKKSRA
jgi:3-oxoacyl-(acyl-carrier-protein) synthase